MIKFNNQNNPISEPQVREINKSPYLLGLLGFIPLVGFFVGVGLTLYGIFKYKDKILTLIGVLCMFFTVFVYSFLFFGMNKFFNLDKEWTKMSQMQMNSLIKNIEFYKLETGKYPDSLKQLENEKEFVSVSDPIKGMKSDGRSFYYENLGNKYLLFSSGIDGIPFTKDDVFPTISINKNIGFVRKK